MEKQLGWVGRESEKVGTETLWKHFVSVNKHPGNAPENLGTGKLVVIFRMRKNYYIHTRLFWCRICTCWSLGGRELVSPWEKLQNWHYQKYGAWWKGRWWQITLFERYEESEDSPELQAMSGEDDISQREMVKKESIGCKMKAKLWPTQQIAGPWQPGWCGRKSHASHTPIVSALASHCDTN